VLLGYDGELDPKLRNRYESEYFSVLSESDVKEFFREWFSDLYSAMPPAERLEGDELVAQVDDTVDQILAHARSADTPGTCYMQRLGIAVEEVVRDLAAV
jgi:hypothetical protein